MSQYYIYKIVSDDCPEFIYVGSTKSLKDRKYKHKQSCMNPKSKNHNYKVYKTIRENGGWDNWRMVLVEECGEISNNQARIREEYHRLQLNSNMNSNRAFRSNDDKKEQKKQYNEANQEKIKECCKEYREANREKIKEYCKEYREANRERIKEHREANREKIKEKDKQYYQANKERIKEHREANRERIKEKQNEKVTCECGCVVTRQNLSKHKKTTKHNKLICPVV